VKYPLALSLLISISFTATAEISVIYGKDHRKDFYQTTGATHKSLSLSTAGMISKAMFQKSSRQGIFDLRQTTTLERAQNVCVSEAFSQQPVAPICSGFLVAPDVLVTAGHCYKSLSTPEVACKSFVWVFDYHMKSPTHNPTLNIPAQNIYLCKKVVAAELSANADFAVIKLDRPVFGRSPLKLRTSGKISDQASLLVIGHPSGLPTKISASGKITRNSSSTRFSTTLDTFHGNSGSAVFNESTGEVEGILIQGKNDYIPSHPSNPKSCMVVNQCDDNGKNCKAGLERGPIEWGEVVLRINQVLPHISAAQNLK
jgi:V8-like Glu-specific endopeptidase